METREDDSLSVGCKPTALPIELHPHISIFLEQVDTPCIPMTHYVTVSPMCQACSSFCREPALGFAPKSPTYYMDVFLYAYFEVCGLVG